MTLQLEVIKVVASNMGYLINETLLLYKSLVINYIEHLEIRIQLYLSSML